MNKSSQETIIKINDIYYQINEEEKTASIIKNDEKSNNILIPRFINHESKEYLITRISENAFEETCNINSIEFSSDSSLLTIEKNSFYL